MTLLVADVDTDEASISVMDPVWQRLFDHQHEVTRSGLVSVTNPHHGDDEDAATYFVQKLRVYCGDSDEHIWTCTCKGYKYHKTPEMGAFSTNDYVELRAALSKIETCKHIDRVRQHNRSEAARADDQGGLEDFETSGEDL